MEPLSESIEENYDRFIVEALETGCVWGLEGPDGWALCPSEKYPDSDVLPFWSQPEFAQGHCVDEWVDYRAVPVSLEELLEDWLPGMHNDVLLAGINWTADMVGSEVEPLDLLRDIEAELR
ncbi:DUF2750 domain-containing protein [Exilibacterium tricleocarpae]|uniref:DUF2750 domain-containing protein n=1 Tax=Exilibacterium tricleocarpae TaxID=2591008 RepID=A0A545TFL6_9GAMM|nr:DUF2750 domain-containing protein [Exilibacterium tricleocarpae]TQV76019.1 DUF2750 domain-containing protein [Exilibacterium tricleocarpae]